MNTREAFEDACVRHAEEAGYDGHERISKDGNNGYADSHTQAAWWGWQAAIEWQKEQPVKLLMDIKEIERKELRDKFAMAALTGLQAPYWKIAEDFISSEDLVRDMSETAYKTADAMLKEREK